MTSGISVIHPDDREVSAADATTGMVRERAIAGDEHWVGLVRAPAGRPSGWHHHGEHESYLYVQSGQLRFEFGPGGSQVVEAGPGDFVQVPAGVIHREVNPGDEEGAVVIVRVGSGASVINVEGPEA